MRKTAKKVKITKLLMFLREKKMWALFTSIALTAKYGSRRKNRFSEEQRNKTNTKTPHTITSKIVTVLPQNVHLKKRLTQVKLREKMK